MPAKTIKNLAKTGLDMIKQSSSSRVNNMVGRGAKNVVTDAVKSVDKALVDKGVFIPVERTFHNAYVGRAVNLGYSLPAIGLAGAAGVGVATLQQNNQGPNREPYTSPPMTASPYQHVFGPPRRGGMDHSLGATGEIPLALHKNR